MSKYLGLSYLVGLLSLALLYQNCGMDGFSASANKASFSQADQSPVDVDINEGNTDLNTLMDFDSRDGEGSELPSHLVNMDTDKKDQAEEQMQVPNPGRYNFVSGQGQQNCQDMVQGRLGVELECTRGGGCGVTCGIPGKNCASANPQHYGLCVEVGNNGQVVNYTKPEVVTEVSDNPVTETDTSDAEEMSSEPLTTLYPFFEAKKHNHILVKDPNELSQLPDYIRLREVIKIYANGGASRAAIYRCRQDLDEDPQASPPISKGNHFVSLAADCEGQTREALYGYLETTRKTLKHWPLYRLVHPVRRDHVVTFDLIGYQRGGYQPEIVLGYVELP